jgi:diaminopropionate ammonia-lyase
LAAANPIHDFSPDLHSDPGGGLRLVVTPADRFARPYGPEQAAVISRSDMDEAHSWLVAFPGYAPTPLVSLPGLAGRLGVAQLDIKHEGYRFGVGSFKALGPPYALARLLAEIGGLEGSPAAVLGALARGESPKSALRVCTATSGNHGRALAWAAQLFRCPCVIYMPEATSPHREHAIRAFGAEVVRVPGNYDQSLVRTRHDSEREGWILIGEPASKRSINVPRHTLHGYSVLGQELIDAAKEAPPTHVFVSAGGGKLAAGVVGAWWLRAGDQRPRIVVVAPHQADSPLRSIAAGQSVPAAGDLTTLMDGLSVGQISPLAWPMLDGGAAAVVTISDRMGIEALRILAHPAPPDPVVEIGETGVAALAGLLAASAEPQARKLLGLDHNSRVIAIGCEGVTDPVIYRKLVDGSG